MMRRLVGEFMTGKITRRGFVAGMLAAGYSASAAKSAAQAVAPQAAKGKELTRVIKATGGELLAEQISETGAKYIFVSNGSGLGPLCDAMVARGWYVGRQAEPVGIHMALNPIHHENPDEYLEDLRASVRAEIGRAHV